MQLVFWPTSFILLKWNDFCLFVLLMLGMQLWLMIGWVCPILDPKCTYWERVLFFSYRSDQGKENLYWLKKRIEIRKARKLIRYQGRPPTHLPNCISTQGLGVAEYIPVPYLECFFNSSKLLDHNIDWLVYLVMLLFQALSTIPRNCGWLVQALMKRNGVLSFPG